MPIVGKNQRGFINSALKPVRKKFMVSPGIVRSFRRFAASLNLSQNALLKRSILEMLEQLGKENLMVYAKLLEQRGFLDEWEGLLCELEGAWKS
ncbi:hypothetical protein [Helicobacter ailurogastricus]|uniref:hypothetical protein n=1 Tax=Helicobacter ailurogastricus TaxID=1578720 RepID=UPI000CF06C8E|nr:hypothetical protein [Helicobacter ailurogastricus]